MTGALCVIWLHILQTYAPEDHCRGFAFLYNAYIELQGTTQNCYLKNLGSLDLLFSRVAPTKTLAKKNI